MHYKPTTERSANVPTRHIKEFPPTQKSIAPLLVPPRLAQSHVQPQQRPVQQQPSHRNPGTLAGQRSAPPLAR